ncbi:MAG: oligosaccharide repeat unit polymerase [Clostridiales bacterium]|nr:oligosaccharide repeat unit polymerase [Clostridiales bacterium]
MTAQTLPNKILIKGKNNSVSSRGVYCCFFSLFILSVIVMIVILLDFDKPNHYSLLFLLPLSYICLLIITAQRFKSLLINFGTILIILLEFIKLVLSPLFLTLSGYVEVIHLNVEQNTSAAILLLAYEAIAIAVAFIVPSKKRRISQTSSKSYRNGIKKLHVVMIMYTVMLAIMCLISPDILLSHRTFLGVFTDKTFTHMTLDSVVNNFAGSEFQRYVLMLSRFFLLPYRLLLPAYLIFCIKYYKFKHGKFWSFVVSFTPLLFVSDVIAQSIYFTLFLLFLTIYLYHISYKVTLFVFVTGVCMVGIYFVGRFFVTATDDSNFVSDMSRRLIAYFSGLNITSGVFNQPTNFDNKVQYFLYDFLTAIPFNKTLLGLDQSISTATLFNYANSVSGQIPTTIGMGFYYFGPVFSPIYSFVLAFVAKRFGEKLRAETIPLYYIIYLYMLFILALGICMYNIEIAFNTIVQAILPIFIIAKICFKRKKS